MRVLIADDDPVCLRLLRASLERMRHEVIVAHDGQEAWDLFRKTPIPLVITDWLMPHMSGIELCENIRAEARERYSYIIIVTTLSDAENTLLGFRAGADDYLAKPLRFDELERRIAVAQRVRQGMNAKIEATLRSAVETCQSVAGPSNASLLQSVQTLGDFYRTERAFTKARAFLRRQLAILRDTPGKDEELARLRRELESLEGLEDECA